MYWLMGISRFSGHVVSSLLLFVTLLSCFGEVMMQLSYIQFKDSRIRGRGNTRSNRYDSKVIEGTGADAMLIIASM